MIIKQDGKIDNEVTAINLQFKKDGKIVFLDDNQFFQITPTGKRLELWEGKEELLDPKNAIGAGMRRVSYWNVSSVVFFGTEKENKIIWRTEI